MNLYLESKRLRITSGTIVDGTILHAPSSTKNREIPLLRTSLANAAVKKAVAAAGAVA